MRSRISAAAITAIATVVCVQFGLATSEAQGEPIQSASSPAVVRYGGADRYEVAVNVAQNFDPGVPVVYVVKGTDYPDALSAAPAASAAGGPLLLVRPGDVPAVVDAELTRLRPQKIVVVGGTASIQPQVFDKLSTFAPSIVRLAGADRYDASRAVVSYAFGDTGVTRVYVATGANFPDALSASAAAGTRGAAVVLVPGKDSSFTAATTTLIQSLHPYDARIAGGANSVSVGIEATLSALSLPGGSDRLSGADRYEASRNINHDTFSTAPNVFIATGTNFPDALAGAALAGRDHAPLYEVPTSCVPQHTYQDIVALNPATITILGGPNSVSPAVESLTECVNPISASASYSCGSPMGLSATIVNPNDFDVELHFAYSGVGVNTGGAVTVAANGTQTFSSLIAFAEDTDGLFTVSYRGSQIYGRSVHVDCASPPPPPKPSNPGDSKNCGDFSTWPAAQAWFDTYYPDYGDIAMLDQDGDHIACESLPGHP